MFALAYSIKVRKVAKRSTKPLWFGVSLFTTISIYGNLAYGLLATSGNLPGWIVASRPYVLAGSLPILVLFLSELLSDDRQHANEQAAKVAKKQAKSPKMQVNDVEKKAAIADLNASRQSKIAERRQTVRQLHREGMPPKEIALQVGVKVVRTIKKDIAALNGSVTQ